MQMKFTAVLVVLITILILNLQGREVWQISAETFLLYFEYENIYQKVNCSQFMPIKYDLNKKCVQHYV